VALPDGQPALASGFKLPFGKGAAVGALFLFRHLSFLVWATCRLESQT